MTGAGDPQVGSGCDSGARAASPQTSDLLEEYKLFVEMADRLSARRQTANAFFMIVHSGLTTLYAILGPQLKEGIEAAWHYLVPYAGVMLCIIWGLHLRSFRLLSHAKFAVIERMETQLPFAPYTEEWKKLSKKERRHIALTTTEYFIPVAFGLLYVALAAVPFFR